MRGSTGVRRLRTFSETRPAGPFTPLQSFLELAPLIVFLCVSCFERLKVSTVA